MVKFECGSRGLAEKVVIDYEAIIQSRPPLSAIRPLSISTTHRKQHSLSHFSIQIHFHTQNHNHLSSAGSTASPHSVTCACKAQTWSSPDASSMRYHGGCRLCAIGRHAATSTTEMIASRTGRNTMSFNLKDEVANIVKQKQNRRDEGRPYSSFAHACCRPGILNAQPIQFSTERGCNSQGDLQAGSPHAKLTMASLSVQEGWPHEATGKMYAPTPPIWLPNSNTQVQSQRTPLDQLQPLS